MGNQSVNNIYFIIIFIIFLLVTSSLFIVKINNVIFAKIKLKDKLFTYILLFSQICFVLMFLLLQIEYNSVDFLWYIAIDIALMIVIYIVLCIILRPLKKTVSHIISLADNAVELDIKISGCYEFNSLKFYLKKILNNNATFKLSLSERDKLYQKFLPKEYMYALKNKDISSYYSGMNVQVDRAILFCDLRDSYFASTTLSLEENFMLINNYLVSISNSIKQNNGFVDKYMGDGILAVFNTVQDAIMAGNEIAKNLSYTGILNLGADKVDFGISIDYGKVVVGVVGGSKSLSITVISNIVNTVSRLERVNKNLGSKVIFTKQALNSLSETSKLNYRYLGNNKYDKIVDSVPLFEAIDWYTEIDRAKFLNTINFFETAVRSYEQKEYKKAIKFFNECLIHNPNDVVAKTLLAKCKNNI